MRADMVNRKPLPRSAFIQIKVRPDHKATLVQAAEAARMSLSEFLISNGLRVAAGVIEAEAKETR